jgi:hypothetical protein
MKKHLNAFVISLILSCLLSPAIFSQTLLNNIFDYPKPKTYVGYKTDKPLVIDGKLNEDVWQKAVWTDSFVDIEGSAKPKPRFTTRAKMLWDDNYLYIAAQLEEPDIWAKLRERDTIIFFDNDFEVFLDPNGDTHQYFEFEMNAFNTVWDLLLVKPYRDQGSAIYEWNYNHLKSGVYAEGTINNPNDKDKYWTVELAFPWADLKDCAETDVPPKNGDQWRINFSRVEWKTEVKDGSYVKSINPSTGKSYPEDNWVWSPQIAVNMHLPEMWGFLQFSDKPVGSEEDKFIYNTDEDAKWALRQIYYEQTRYFEKNKNYCPTLEGLGLENLKVEGYTIDKKIQCTDDLFEIKIKNLKSGYSLYIFQDGKIIKK